MSRSAVRNLLLIAVLLVISSCSSNSQAESIQRESQAQIEARQIIQGLPVVENFTAKMWADSSSSQSSLLRTCYHGQAYLVLGSSLPEQQAVDTYASELVKEGWKEGRQPSAGQHSLAQGASDRLVVHGGEPSAFFKKEEFDFAPLRNLFTSLVFVELDHARCY